MPRFSQIASSMERTRITGREMDLNTIAMRRKIAAMLVTAVTAKSMSVVSMSPCVTAPSPVMRASGSTLETIASISWSCSVISGVAGLNSELTIISCLPSCLHRARISSGRMFPGIAGPTTWLYASTSDTPLSLEMSRSMSMMSCAGRESSKITNCVLAMLKSSFIRCSPSMLGRLSGSARSMA